jgi:coenzyme PQQ synthesis protein D (PqqD)
MPTSIEAEADAILDGDGHRKTAQATWERLTQADLNGVRTKRDLVARVEERYGVPREQASADVEVWASDKRFSTWTA